MLALFLLYVFFQRDLFQVTGTDASCVLYIICSQFIVLSKSRFVIPITAGLLHCWHHFMPFCFALSLICFWLNLIVRITSELSLSCADLRKVSTEEDDHVISQILVLVAEIEGNCFYITLSILLVWDKSGLFNVSL